MFQKIVIKALKIKYKYKYSLKTKYKYKYSFYKLQRIFWFNRMTNTVT